MAETWDESKPAGSRSPALGDDDIREHKRAVRERLAEDHDFEATESPAFGAALSTIGKHKFVTLVQRNTSKTTLTDEVAFVCKEVSGSPELLLTPPSAGTDRQLTKNAGANLNLVSGDFDSLIIPAAAYQTESINASTAYSDIADFGVRTAQLNTSAVTPSQLDTGAVTPTKLDSLETAGDTPYFISGDLAGNSSLTSQESYTTLTNIRFITPGTFRFYWGYSTSNTDNNGYFQVKKNNAVILGPYSRKNDTYTYRTDDLTIESGDLIEFQAKTQDETTLARIKIYMRGTNCMGLFHYS